MVCLGNEQRSFCHFSDCTQVLHFELFCFITLPTEVHLVKVVKQDMAGVNVDILGISELKWTGMGEFNSDDHCIYYCGQASHSSRNGVAIMVNKRVQNKAGQRVIELCQENTLVIANTLFQQHKRQLYEWTSPNGQ